MNEYNPTVKQYEDDVLSGQIVAGELLKLAIKRQRNDLKNGHKRGLYFDHEAGQHILDFFDLLNLAPNTPFVLEPWQMFELYVFYGWKVIDTGLRRFQYKYKTVSRKNGKTPLESGQILYHLLLSGVHRAEAYVSATKESQAEICFNDAKAIIEASPDLEDSFNSTATTIYCPETASKFQFLTSNPKTADGTRPSFALIDEYHEFENDKMLAKLRTGQIHHKEPIFNIVTTRGSHKDWPCFENERRVYVPILKGTAQLDNTFVLIFSQDAEDEFDKPETWAKSNPMLGSILNIEKMIKERDTAVMKGQEDIVSFKTLNMNWWCDAPTTFIPDNIWIKSGTKWNEDILHGRECWAGLDMGQTNDFCALGLLFPPEDWEAHDEPIDDDDIVFIRNPVRVPGKYHMLWRFWIPEDKFESRIQNGLHALRDWEKAGLIRFLEGNVIDPREIEKDIKLLNDVFPIRSLAYDRYNATSTALNLQEHGIPCAEFPQMMSYFAEPTKAFRDLVLQTRLDHGMNPIAQWMMRSAVPITDTNGNIKITKDPKRATEKVDGIVAGIMAAGSWMSDRSPSRRSRYEDEGSGIFML